MAAQGVPAGYKVDKEGYLVDEKTGQRAVDEAGRELKVEGAARPLVRVVSPIERPEFETFVDLYMKKRGLDDKAQAAIKLTKLFTDMGLDPYSELDEVAATVSNITTVLDSLPDTEGTKRVKDIISARTAGWAQEKLMQGGEPDTMERRLKMMERAMYMKEDLKMLRNVFSEEGGEGMSKETEARLKTLEERERQREQELEFERQLQPVRNQLEKLGDSVKGLQDALSKLEERLSAPPAQPAPQPVPPEVQQRLDYLEGEVKKRDEMIAHSQLSSEILGKVREELERIVEKGGDMRLMELVNTLRTLGVPVGGSEGWPVPSTVPTWAFMVRDPKFRQGIRELSSELIEDFSGAVVRGIGGVGGREEIGIKLPKGFTPPEKPKIGVRLKPEVEKPPEKPAGIPPTLFEVK